MTLSAGTVSLGVKPDTRGFGDSLHRGLMGDSGVLGAGKSIGGLLMKGVAAVGIAASIGGIVKTGMGELMDASAGTAQLTAGIKSTGNAAHVSVDGMNSLASSIQAYSGQTDDSIVKSEQLLLTFTNIKNNGPDKIFDQATKASANMAAKMGGDASGSAILLGKALNDPIKGISALSRVGVSFSDSQKASIASMVKLGDTAGAQKVILKELGTEFGGAAKAAGESLPGMVNRGKRAFEDLSQTVATMLLPVLVPVLSGIVSLLQRALPHVQAFGDGVGKAFALIGSTGKTAFEGIKTAGSGLATALGPVLSTISGAFASLVPVLSPLVPQVLALASAFSPVQLIFKALKPVLPQLVTLIGTLAATLAGALGSALTDLLPSITRLAGTLTTDLANTLVALLPMIVQLATMGVSVLTGTMLFLLPILSNVSSFLADNAHMVIGGIAAYMGFRAVNAVMAAARGVQLGFAAASYGSAASSYASGAAAKIGALGYAFMNSTLYKGVAAWVASTAAQIANTEGGILAKAVVVGSAVAMGVATAAQWLWNAAMSANPIGIIIVVLGALVAGIIWVATQTTFFQDAWRNMTKFIGEAWRNVTKFIGDAIAAVVKWISQHWGLLLSILIGPIGLVIQWIVEHWGGITKFFQGVLTNVSAAFGTVFGGIGRVIRGAFDGVVGFIKGIINSVIDVVNGAIGAINGIAGAVKNATGLPIDIHLGTIPHLAKGGIVPATPGGRLVRVAEAGEDEAVIPLSKAHGLLGGSGSRLPEFITLVDADGSILTRARVVAGQVVAAAANVRAGQISRGVQV